MHWLSTYPQRHQVYYLTEVNSQTFEQAYLQVRTQEARVYPDEIVKQLPNLPSTHPQYKEWQCRVWSTTNFFKQSTLNPSHSILDIGCGNGWFTGLLAQKSGAQVVGLDINQVELQQAARLFARPNCRFAYGDLFDTQWPAEGFTHITLNACVQYFPNLTDLLQRLLSLLRPRPAGEIHLIDSPFYTPTEIDAARQRSQQYYQDQSVQSMSAHYHHHSWDELRPFAPEVRYHPKQWQAKVRRILRQASSPFPWIVIKSHT